MFNNIRSSMGYTPNTDSNTDPWNPDDPNNRGIDPYHTDPNGGPSYANPDNGVPTPPNPGPVTPPPFAPNPRDKGKPDDPNTPPPGTGSGYGSPYYADPFPHMTGGVTPSPASGPAGVGGTGGYGFVNMASYLNANPMNDSAGGGYAPVPTGMTGSDFNPGAGGFAPAGQYTPGMAAEDNMLNSAYGRTSVSPARDAGGSPPADSTASGGQPANTDPQTGGSSGGTGGGGGGGGGGGAPGRGTQRTLVDDYTNPKNRDSYGYGNIRGSMRTQGY